MDRDKAEDLILAEAFEHPPSLKQFDEYIEEDDDAKQCYINLVYCLSKYGGMAFTELVKNDLIKLERHPKEK
jgi:hypothetical protein